MRILYVGPTYVGSNGNCWRDAFVTLGHEVYSVDSERLIPAARSMSAKVLRKLRGLPPAAAAERLNRVVREGVCEKNPQLVFFVQARHVTAETLRETGRTALSFVYMNDDMFNPRNQTSTFYECLPAFDCILTTKSFNVAEFKDAGAKTVVYQPNAYDPNIHCPVKIAAGEEGRFVGEVAFVGTFRPYRADFLAALMAQVPEFHYNVWGGGWHKVDRLDYVTRYFRWRRLKRTIRGPDLWGRDMSKAIGANKVCLGLLHKTNRDLHTSRTFEIPAAGGFMLAERTSEHLEFFKEDKEAAYFTDIEELKSKLRFYLRHETTRLSIARAGHRKCVESPFRYTDRAIDALQWFHKLR